MKDKKAFKIPGFWNNHVEISGLNWFTLVGYFLGHLKLFLCLTEVTSVTHIARSFWILRSFCNCRMRYCMYLVIFRMVTLLRSLWAWFGGCNCYAYICYYYRSVKKLTWSVLSVPNSIDNFQVQYCLSFVSTLKFPVTVL